MRILITFDGQTHRRDQEASKGLDHHPAETRRQAKDPKQLQQKQPE